MTLIVLIILRTFLPFFFVSVLVETLCTSFFNVKPLGKEVKLILPLHILTSPYGSCSSYYGVVGMLYRLMKVLFFYLEASAYVVELTWVKA